MKILTRWIVVLAAAIMAATAPATAQTFPKLTGRVVDQANLLLPAQEAELTSKLAALETQTGRQLVVATVASLEGRTIEDYGYRLGREWAIGQTEEDDGVVLLVAPNERKVRIETGYGARVFLTDAMSSVIIRNSILPAFKAGDYAGGINAGADEIIELMRLPPAEAARRAQEVGAAEAKRAEEGINPVPIIVIVVIFFVILSSIARRVGGRRYRGKHGKRRRGFDSGDAAILLWGLEALSHASRGGGGGGGFGGFGGGGGGGFGGFSGGGGSFGGGGASGGW